MSRPSLVILIWARRAWMLGLFAVLVVATITVLFVFPIGLVMWLVVLPIVAMVGIPLEKRYRKLSRRSLEAGHCPLCIGLVRKTDIGGYVCSNCRREFWSTGRDHDKRKSPSDAAARALSEVHQRAPEAPK